MKEYIREAVLKCMQECPNVHEQVVELTALVDQEGEAGCQAILHLFAHVEVPRSQSIQCWQNIVSHHRKMMQALERPISLQTAICDYFSYVQRDLQYPKVIEIKVFEEMVRESSYDYLTGLGNRSTLDSCLEKEIARARRYHREVALLFLDLDNFKQVNDTYGHLAGDAVLREVGRVIASQKRVEDTAGRYGGEEFIVILPDTGKLGALALAERIREKVAAIKVPFEGNELAITISGGLASWPMDAATKPMLAMCADQALYRAKKDGKNRISLYRDEKRRYVRIDFVQQLKVRVLADEDTNRTAVETKNLSLGGVLFESASPIAMESFVELTLDMGSEGLLSLKGQVRRLEALTENSYEVGVSFYHFDEDTTRCLGSYIQGYLHQQGKSCPATLQVVRLGKEPVRATLAG